MGTSANDFGKYLLKKEYLRPYQKLPSDMEKDWDEKRRVQPYGLHDLPKILMSGILCIVLEELILKIVR